MCVPPTDGVRVVTNVDMVVTVTTLVYVSGTFGVSVTTVYRYDDDSCGRVSDR